MAAAAAWAAAEPALGRIFRTPYSDVRLLGGAVTRGSLWWPIGFTVHLANGAAFGAGFERLGGRGWRQGLVAAQVESVGLWPGMALVDRVHPDRKSGGWPRLLTNRRVFAYEVATHAFFGLVLGSLLRDD